MILRGDRFRRCWEIQATLVIPKSADPHRTVQLSCSHCRGKASLLLEGFDRRPVQVNRLQNAGQTTHACVRIGTLTVTLWNSYVAYWMSRSLNSYAASSSDEPATNTEGSLEMFSGSL